MITWDVSIGNVAEVVAFIASAAMLVGSVRTRIKDMGDDIAAVHLEITELRKVFVTQARQDEKLINLEQRITNLDTRMTVLRKNVSD